MTYSDVTATASNSPRSISLTMREQTYGWLTRVEDSCLSNCPKAVTGEQHHGPHASLPFRKLVLFGIALASVMEQLIDDDSKSQDKGAVHTRQHPHRIGIFTTQLEFAC